MFIHLICTPVRIYKFRFYFGSLFSKTALNLTKNKQYHGMPKTEENSVNAKDALF